MAEPPLHLFIYTLLLFSTKYSGRAVDVLFLLLQNHNYSVIMRLGPLFSKKGIDRPMTENTVLQQYE